MTLFELMRRQANPFQAKKCKFRTSPGQLPSWDLTGPVKKAERTQFESWWQPSSLTLDVDTYVGAGHLGERLHRKL
jgi:hypothetical protein